MISPKQPQDKRRRDWYPYYAGFGESFVQSVLSAHSLKAKAVLDPWNGAGTTTVACARNGQRAWGFDINPVMTVVARARLTPCSVSDSLLPLCRDVLRAARKLETEVSDGDVLTNWLRPDSVSRLRAIQQAIHSAVCESLFDLSLATVQARAEALPLLAAFYYTSLFASVRDLLSRFRTTNPTWLLIPTDRRSRLAPGWSAIETALCHRVEFLRDRLTVAEGSRQDAYRRVSTGNAADLPLRSRTFDAALTSPPYATRIDYIRGSMLELAVLGATNDEIQDLRRRCTGSPVVRGVERAQQRLVSPYARRVLREIAAHDSKGSSGYYMPWMSNYFASLEQGLTETARLVKRDGAICVVVQDSHYKELHIDLQRVVSESLASRGRTLRHREDFDARHLISRMNPRARRHLRSRRNSESLLVFS